MSMGSNILLEDVAKLRMNNKQLRDEVARLKDALERIEMWGKCGCRQEAAKALTPQGGKGCDE